MLGGMLKQIGRMEMAPMEVFLVGVLSSMVLILLGGILIFVGAILFGIMLIRLGDLENVSDKIHTAGILYIIGMVLLMIPYVNIIGSILTLISVVMVYLGAKETLSELKS